jgi:hypothetical protein
MANTYEAIATVEVGSGGTANIEFTSIPATFTDLIVKAKLELVSILILLIIITTEYEATEQMSPLQAMVL